MTDMITTEELREHLRAHLDAVVPPPGDLDAVRRRSRRDRAQRVRRAAGAGLVAAAVTATALVIAPFDGDDKAPDRVPRVASTGEADASQGLRAFAEPGGNLYMAGATLPDAIELLDTDAVATPYGVAFYDAGGRPSLLTPEGRTVPLDESPSEPADGFHPTIKADAVQPYVAFALMDGKDVTVTVYDLEERSVVATTTTSCSPACPDLVIDAIDSGAVFLRWTSGTSVWDYERDQTMPFAGPETRVADVRNGVVLYDGARPDRETDGWRLVPGAIDAQLSFDGGHVLYWSDTLEPTTPGGTPIELDLPVPATFFTIDTDGSVLAATVNDPVRVFDCEIPSGACEEIGEMNTLSGDPIFIGSDM